METNTLDSETEYQSCREPIIRSLSTYYFCLFLGFFVPFIFIFIMDILTNFRGFLSWFNTPKYYDPDHPLPYFWSILPEGIITLSLFFTITYCIGFITTFFLKKYAIGIYWKKLAGNAYAQGIFFSSLIIFSFLYIINDSSAAIIFSLILMNVFSSLYSFLILYINRSSDQKTYGLILLDKIIFYTTAFFVLVVNLNFIYSNWPYFIITEYFLISEDYFGVTLFILLTSLLLFFGIKFLVCIISTLSSLGKQIKKRNISIIYLIIFPVLYFIFNPHEIPIILYIPIIIIPFALHYLSILIKHPLIRNIFSLY